MEREGTRDTRERIDVLYVDGDHDDGSTTGIEHHGVRLDVERVPGVREARRGLADAGVDCVVVAERLPDVAVLELLETVGDDRPELPCIVHADASGERVGPALRAAATDCVRSDGIDPTLARRIVAAVDRDHRDLHRGLVAGATDAITLLDADGVCRYRNGAAADVLGRSAGDLLGERFLASVHPTDREAVREAVAEAADGHGSAPTVEHRFRRGDDSWVWLESVHGRVDAPVEGVVVVSRDITERKRRERDLRRAKRLFEALSRTFPDYIFVYDADGEYLDVITGRRGGTTEYTAEDLIGRTVEDVLPVADAERLRATIRRALDTDDLERVEYEVGDCWYEGTAVAVPDGYDGDPAVVMAARDITARKARARQLRRQNERLEEFASIVSHELRNPIGIAKGHLGLARDGDVEALDRAAEAIERMETIVEEVLTLARMGETVETTTPVGLGETARDAWRQVPTGDASLVVGDDATVHADRDRLLRAFENLFRNAVEHNDDPVTVRVDATDDGFSVADDGRGIPAADREAVLEHGYTTETEGVGLGLSIVRDIAAAHGWTIAVRESRAGGVRIEVTGVRTG